jgi:hypothetical protein
MPSHFKGAWNLSAYFVKPAAPFNLKEKVEVHDFDTGIFSDDIVFEGLRYTFTPLG